MPNLLDMLCHADDPEHGRVGFYPPVPAIGTPQRRNVARTLGAYMDWPPDQAEAYLQRVELGRKVPALRLPLQDAAALADTLTMLGATVGVDLGPAANMTDRRPLPPDLR